MTRKNDASNRWPAGLIFLLPGLILSSCAGKNGDGEEPNVIIILADDLGCGDMSLYNGWIKTPRLDQIVGIDIPRQRILDGISIRDHLLNQADIPDRQVFFGYEPKLGTAMRDGNWKMLTKGDSIELYDLSQDIRETINVTDKYPERAEQMKAAIDLWKLEVTPVATSER